jgi:hypothetical protein
MWCCGQPDSAQPTRVRPCTHAYGKSFQRGEPGHIYVVCEREFIKTGEPIYKLGKSTNIKSRMPNYPKNSLIVSIFHTKELDVHRIEREMITRFDTLFIQRADIGREYYEGDVSAIVDETTKMMVAVYSSVM